MQFRAHVLGIVPKKDTLGMFNTEKKSQKHKSKLSMIACVSVATNHFNVRRRNPIIAQTLARQSIAATKE